MSHLGTIDNLEHAAASVRAQAGVGIVVISAVFVLRASGVIDLSDLVLGSMLWLCVDRFRQASRIYPRARAVRAAPRRHVDARLN